MMRKEQAVLAAALVLIMLVASSLGQLAEAQHYDVLNITLCLTQALFFDNHGGNLTMIHPPLVSDCCPHVSDLHVPDFHLP